MLKTISVETLLRETKKLPFEKIWAKVKTEVLENFDKSKEKEVEVKNDFYLSMMLDENLIMLGDNVWSLKENYSIKEIETIHDKLLGDELEKAEEGAETEEMSLDLVEDDLSEGAE